MKIAIYGDSFAADYNGWPLYLKKILKCSVVHSYGLHGGSAEYAYSMFLQTHEKYDVILFLWTSTNRSSLILKENSRFKCKSSVFISGNGETCVFKDVIENNIKNVKVEYSKEYTDWISNEYRMLIKFPTKNKIYHESMRDSVKYKRPDAIHIECFSGLIYDHAYNKTYGIQNIINTQFIKFGLEAYYNDVTRKTIKENEKKIKNHISLIQNLELAKYIHKSILDRNFDIHETFAQPEKYYTMVNTLEESGYIIE